MIRIAITPASTRNSTGNALSKITTLETARAPVSSTPLHFASVALWQIGKQDQQIGLRFGCQREIDSFIVLEPGQSARRVVLVELLDRGAPLGVPDAKPSAEHGACHSVSSVHVLFLPIGVSQ
jgi:hypothetical protein